MASKPTSVTQYQTGIAPELAPYMQDLLGQQAGRMYTYAKDDKGNPIMVGPEGQPLTQNAEGKYVDSAGKVVEAASPKISGFQPYEGYETADRSRVAGLTDLQTGAFDAAKTLGVQQQTKDAATGIEALAKSAGATKYTDNTYANQFTAPKEYVANQFTADKVTAPELQNYQMTGPQDVTAQNFSGQAVQDYMSPYMQNVVKAQQREAGRASQIAGQAQQAEAVGRGAFGGSRDALMRAERERNLATQMGDIEAQGQQQAYQQAQTQFNADQARQMQAALANQGMGYNVGAQNLAANLGVQSLGAGQNMTAQQLNQAGNLQAANMGEQSKQFGYGQGMTAAQLGAQYGLGANQLTEQSKQYGAGLGLQGLQAGMTGYGQLAGMGQDMYNQNIGNITLQSQLGTQKQQQQQNIVNAQYQDWLAKQQYPQQQMDTMASYIRGTPMATTSSSTYNAAPSTVSQITGLGMAGAGAYGMYNSMNPQQRPYKKGGAIKQQKPQGLEALALSSLG